MNVTVFGATGSIGSLTVAELLERGHAVTAYARNPAEVPDAWGDRVRVVIGEVSDADAIDTAIQGADAVISALGPRMDRKAIGTPLVGGTANILTSMKNHGVHRYVGHATPAILDPQEQPTLVTRLIAFMPRTFMPRTYDEITGMSKLIMESCQDWTIVRFIAPKDTPRRASVPGSSASKSSASRSAVPTSPPPPPPKSTRTRTSAARPPSATDPQSHMHHHANEEPHVNHHQPRLRQPRPSRCRGTARARRTRRQDRRLRSKPREDR